MRKYLSALILTLGLATAPVAAHATPVTYDLVLTNVLGNIGGGTGSFTVASAPTSFVNSYTTLNGGLTSMSFLIGGDSFNLGNAISNFGEVDFFLGNLVSVAYAGGTSNKSVNFSLNSGGLFYVFADLDNHEFSQGYITSAVSTAATPEPTAILLFGTGALGLLGFASRKLIA
jgi:hypothetical protein